MTDTTSMSDSQPLAGDPVARVGVIGASGFAGSLAAQLVWRHPRVELVLATARRDVGRRVDELYPRYRVPLTLQEFDVEQAVGLDAALVSYPHGASAPVVRTLLEGGLKVVDLSADFRLRDRAIYENWYGEHGAPDLIEGAAYGLTELHREEIASADLVANPGCYPTAAVLAVAPLAKAGLVENLVVDAKSGVSGAGRDPSSSTHFVSVDENVFPYGVDGHRHAPEIDQELKRLGAPAARFVPHLLPLDQGLLASCYVTSSKAVGGDELASLYGDSYGEERFIELVDDPPGVREVRDTNFCRIHATASADGHSLYVFAAIDNLWKGAAGQAVQNLNLMLGLDEGEGL